jgi:hypothetical protein
MLEDLVNGRVTWIAALGLCAAVCAALLVSPPSGSARACGGVVKKRPTQNAGIEGRAPLAIGDSSMLLAVDSLAAAGFKVNARGCRQMEEGLRVIKSAGHVPHMVVIALGADYVVTKEQIRRALHIVGKKRVLGLVTPRELGGGQSGDARNMREKWRDRKKQVVLLDWVEHSAGHDGWFQPDGLHLTYSGASAFTRFLSNALPFAEPGEFPRGARFPR